MPAWRWLAGSTAETRLLVLLIALAKGIDAISDIYYGLFQQRERMGLVSRGLIGNGVLSLILLATGVLATGELVVGVVGYVLGSLVPLVGYVIPASRSLTGAGAKDSGTPSPEWSTGAVRRLALTSLPMGVVMLLVSVNANLPLYVIERTLGSADLGIYTALAYLIVAGATVVNSIGQAVSPRLAQLYSRGETRSYLRLMGRLVGFGLLCGAAGALLSAVGGAEILSLLYGPGYAGHVPVLVLLSIAGGVGFAASFAGYGMTAARLFAVQIPLFLVVDGVVLASAVALVPTHGLGGAAMAILVGALVQLAASLLVIARSIRRAGGLRHG